jgi:hypothetical protein
LESDKPSFRARKNACFKKLMENGVSGNIATLDPPFSPMLWTTIATGKYPDKHGILGFIEPDPSGGVRPVNSTSRTSRALWNIFTHKGYKSNIVSWWPSHPAEPINGTMVSNFFHKEVSDDLDKEWVIAPDSVYPKSLENVIADLRMHPQRGYPCNIFCHSYQKLIWLIKKGTTELVVFVKNYLIAQQHMPLEPT